MKACPRCKMRYPNDASQCFIDGMELSAVADPRIGQLVAGRYVVDSVLGEGGMATVYRARHKLVDRPVAIKIMHSVLGGDEVAKERFRREAKSAQRLTHPNIIEVFDQGELDSGEAYIVMELLDGQCLAEVLHHGAMPIERALPLMIQIARGLARAHDLDVVHRDVKPENIYLCRRADGTELIKLLDFGIAWTRTDARLTNQGELFGTPQYMAPERIMSMDVGAASDIYALGVVFFEMLTGTLPFEAPDVASFFVKHINEPPPLLRSRAPDLPVSLEDLVGRMLEKDPKNRPVDAHRVHQDLLACIEELSLAAPPPATAESIASGTAPLTLPEADEEEWVRRAGLLAQMMDGATSLAPEHRAEIAATLDEIVQASSALLDNHRQAVEVQQRVETIEQRGREARHQLGFAVDQLGVDGSKARDEARSADERQAVVQARVEGARAAYLVAQRELMRAEGRSGLVEPSEDLVRAHEGCQRAASHWLAAQRDAAALRLEGDAARKIVHDIDYQIAELRAALAKSDARVEEERAGELARLDELGRASDRLESDLERWTAAFCAPLRGERALAPLFEQLASPSAEAP